MYKLPGGLYLEGRFNGFFFFCVASLTGVYLGGGGGGAYIWRGLYTEGRIFGILRYIYLTT